MWQLQNYFFFPAIYFFRVHKKHNGTRYSHTLYGNTAALTCITASGSAQAMDQGINAAMVITELSKSTANCSRAYALLRIEVPHQLRYQCNADGLIAEYAGEEKRQHNLCGKDAQFIHQRLQMLLKRQ